MECSGYQRLISRMIDGECDDVERESVDVHLRECERCRAFFASMRDVNALHRGLGETSPPLTLTARVMAAVEQPERRSRFAGLMRAAVPVAAAAVLILGFYAGSCLVALYGQPVSNGRLAALELEYLDEYPPGSVGDVVMTATEGGNDVQ
jgi:anti-sigma factor RsiW